MTGEPFSESWDAIALNVPIARRTVVAHLKAADTSEPPLNDIALALSEAVTNVVNHAYVGRLPGPVTIRIEMGEQQIELSVQDEGSGMVPRPDTPGLGLGMPLIATLADRLDVRAPRDGGTCVCMWFAKDPGAAVLPE